MKILIVEDEKKLADTLTELLQKENYEVDAVYDGKAGLDYALSNVYDVIVLDIMLPKMDGFQVVKQMRNNRCNIPVIMLTARGEPDSKVCGLNSGADDYLAKPFYTPELIARINALTRRHGEKISEAFSFGDINMDISSAVLCCGCEQVRLGKKEKLIMEILLSNGTRIVKKDRVLEKVWGFNSEAEYNNLEVYISFLRKKLLSISSKTQIKAMRGIGYYLEEEND